MAPSSSGVATTKKKHAPAAVRDPIVGGKINQLYSIGSFLGEGEFGKVYSIKNDKDGNENEWAVKIVPYSPISLTTTKNKKSATTSSDRLHYEHLMYSNLSHLCGTILPILPSNHLHRLNSFYSTIHIDNATMISNDNSGTLWCCELWWFRCGVMKQFVPDSY